LPQETGDGPTAFNLLQSGEDRGKFCIIMVHSEAGYEDENQRHIIKPLTDLSDYQLFFSARSHDLESVHMQELSFYRILLQQVGAVDAPHGALPEVP
jgi:hypothetical protein